MKRTHYLFMLCVIALAYPAWAKDKANKLAFTFGGHARTAYYYVPDDPARPTDESAANSANKELPVVFLLHGSGRDGTEMIDAWKSLAAAEHFIIVAPNSYDPATWDSQNDGVAFLHEVVAQIKAIHPVDIRRVYLFGHSGGAVYALAMILVDSEYYAATAVHAGALSPQNEHLFQRATRKTPVAIWVGDHDASFPVDQVKATKAMFEAHGFQVQFTVIPNHSHLYNEVSESVDRQAWKFFKNNQLPQPQ